MSAPQLENGYTRIANEILENCMRADLNGTQWNILHFVWRYSFGFQRKWASCSLSALVRATGRAKAHVSRELNALIERGILKESPDGDRTKAGMYTTARKLEFEKDAAKWKSKQGGQQLMNPSTVDESNNGTVDESVNGTVDESVNPSKKLHKNRKKPAPRRVEIPATLAAREGFSEAWEKWVRHRQEIRKPLTSTTIEAQLRRLASQTDPVGMIMQSIENGWQGLFEIRQNGTALSGSGGKSLSDFIPRIN